VRLILKGFSHRLSGTLQAQDESAIRSEQHTVA
jgi:hypothetical protein